jgi:hypothetical protein
MHNIDELDMIKSKSIAYQHATVDDLTSRFIQAADSIPDEILRDELADLSREDSRQAMRYCLLAIIAADIATVPYPEGREFHMRTLTKLAKSYGLSRDKIIYLTRYADQMTEHFQALEEHKKRKKESKRH